jgi:transcription elongation GreA/GreB family factor
MARSLIKKELGEYVEVETPGGVKEYEITEIKLV